MGNKIIQAMLNKRGPHEGMIRQKLQNFVCKYFSAGGEMGVME